MKRHFGARPAESFMHSKYWIAASLKSEGTVLDLERKLTSIANDRCLRDRTFVSPQPNSPRVRLSRNTTGRRSHFSTFLQFFDAIIPEGTPRRTLAFVHRVERSDVQCVRH